MNNTINDFLNTYVYPPGFYEPPSNFLVPQPIRQRNLAHLIDVLNQDPAKVIPAIFHTIGQRNLSIADRDMFWIMTRYGYKPASDGSYDFKPIPNFKFSAAKETRPPVTPQKDMHHIQTKSAKQSPKRRSRSKRAKSKSPKRKSPKRKSRSKRAKSSKRKSKKSPKRKSKSPKRKSLKRRSKRAKSPKRKSRSKRAKSPKRKSKKSPKRRSPKRKSPKRKSKSRSKRA